MNIVKARTVRIVNIDTCRLAVYSDNPPPSDFAATLSDGSTLVANGEISRALKHCELFEVNDIWLSPVLLAISKVDQDLVEQPVRAEMQNLRHKLDDANAMILHYQRLERQPLLKKLWRIFFQGPVK